MAEYLGNAPLRDLLGSSAWLNRFPGNPTQNIFRRFVKTPGAELTDRLKEHRDKFSEFGKKTLKTHLSEYLED